MKPHDDPLVIMLTIKGFNTRRVLMDNGSSIDVMYMTAFQQMKLDTKRIKPFGFLLLTSAETVFIQRASFHYRLKQGPTPFKRQGW